MIRKEFSLRREIILVAAVLSTVFSIQTNKSLALLQNSPKELLDEAWQLVYREYVDRTFNHSDWMRVRQEYLERSYDSKQQVYQAIREMLSKLDDPYTDFLDPQELRRLTNDVSGDFVGVGITVALDEQTKEWIVVETATGSPASEAGIMPNDIIKKINGKSTSEISSETASNYIVGPLGSHVFLNIKRGNRELNFNLLRDHIDLYPLFYRIQNAPIGKIGYICLPEFTSHSPQAMRDAIAELEKQQVKGYILDLRSNPGGILNASIDIARMWLTKGTIVEIINRQGEKERITANQNYALVNKPLVVLVNGDSASDSEILAAALQENKRAILVGTKTFGKGLVQALETLTDGSAIKITVAKYYTPTGQDINKRGIVPNVVVPLTQSQQETLMQNHAFGTLADPQYTRAISKLTERY